jgi:hypothetical protein
MPARKTTKKSTKKAGKAKAAQPETGSVPPYGEAIRGAIARGDAQESALKQLEGATKKSKK